MSDDTLRRADLVTLLNRSGGLRAFEAVLAKINDYLDLLSMFGRYVHFNSQFAAGVANLVAAVAAKPNLFRSRTEQSKLMADCSIEVASFFFATIIDEFGGKADPRRATHRQLAQSTLKLTANFFGHTTAELDELVRPGPATLAAVSAVLEGYGLGQPIDEAKLFNMMGFHLASELYADREFCTLDAFLRSRVPDLVDYLQNTTGPDGYSGDSWVHIHTSLEADHFALTLNGCNNAMRHYAGAADKSTLKTWILEGFALFGSVLWTFMDTFMRDRI